MTRYVAHSKCFASFFSNREYHSRGATTTSFLSSNLAAVPCTHGMCRLLYCYVCYQLATVTHRKTYEYLQCDNVGRSDCLRITRHCYNSSSDLSHSVIMSRFVIQILGFCQRGSFVHHFPPRGSVMGCDLM